MICFSHQDVTEMVVFWGEQHERIEFPSGHEVESVDFNKSIKNSLTDQPIYARGYLDNIADWTYDTFEIKSRIRPLSKKI